MSGHSKWSTIKRAKGATDAKRAAQFTKVSREITIAARISGPDPASNPRLRLAVDKGRSLNMPNDNIKRAIERAAGLGQSDAYEEITYEGYGPGGVAVLVEAATDNRNRTASDVRSLFTKAGGSLASSGAVAWQFEARGVIECSGALATVGEAAMCTRWQTRASTPWSISVFLAATKRVAANTAWAPICLAQLVTTSP